jgi:hypothetical protein
MIEITKYTSMGKGLILGKFDIVVPKWGGFYIREILLMQKGSARWISLPSKSYESEGEKKFYSYNGFKEDKMLRSFQEQVMKSLDEYFKRSACK